MRERLLNAWRSSPAAAWWRGKPAHEQWVYASLGAAAAVVFLWLGLWRPLADWQVQQANREVKARQLFAWVSANEAAARAAASMADSEAPTDAASIIPLITQAAGDVGVRLNRLQPESSGSVSLLLQEQRFDQVVSLIARLQESGGVAVERASIDADQRLGHVDAQLRLVSNHR